MYTQAVSCRTYRSAGTRCKPMPKPAPSLNTAVASMTALMASGASSCSADCMKHDNRCCFASPALKSVGLACVYAPRDSRSYVSRTASISSLCIARATRSHMCWGRSSTLSPRRRRYDCSISLMRGLVMAVYYESCVGHRVRVIQIRTTSSKGLCHGPA